MIMLRLHVHRRLLIPEREATSRTLLSAQKTIPHFHRGVGGAHALAESISHPFHISTGGWGVFEGTLASLLRDQ